MAHTVTCPACGFDHLDICDYRAMMVVRSDLALFRLQCPRCAASVSAVHPIPVCLRDEVRFAAIEVGAGMGLEG